MSRFRYGINDKISDIFIYLCMCLTVIQVRQLIVFTVFLGFTVLYSV